MYINYHTAISLILFLYKITIILNLIKKMELKSLNNKFPKEKNDNLNYSILESETNKYIWQYKQLDWKQRLSLWFAAKKMFPVARCFQTILKWQHELRHL